MRDWVARFERDGEIYEIPQKPYHEVASKSTYDDLKENGPYIV